MKKFIALAIACASAISADAQAFEGNRPADNWSLGVHYGSVSPSKGNLIKDARHVAGVEVTKYLTPVFGLGISGTAGFNTTGSRTFVDNATGLLLGKVNFSNLFCGYKGSPRYFEVEGVAGIGINHYFGETDKYAVAEGNTMASKFGVNLNFNLGKKKAWTVSVRPAIAYDLEGGRQVTQAQYNLNNSVLELTTGIIYRFRSSNGKHYFTQIKAYDFAEVDGLNAKVNDLRATVNGQQKALNIKDAEIRQLQQALNDCRNSQPVVETVEVFNTNLTMESVVNFRQGKSTVETSQLPNIERIATYMKKNGSSRVVIKGYASPEGNAEVNAHLAAARAKAVSDVLVKKYGIAADRITAEGQGVGNMFSDPDWNRVSICTLVESE